MEIGRRIHQQPDRYNVLLPGDFAIIEFQGRIFPTAAKLILISQTLPVDQPVHAELATLLGGRSMIVLSTFSYAELVEMTARRRYDIYRVFGVS